MSTYIKPIEDKDGNTVLPITNTKAVYDDDGNRLDNIIEVIPKTVKLPDYNKTLRIIEEDVSVFTPISFSEDCYVSGQLSGNANVSGGVWIGGTSAFDSIVYAPTTTSTGVYGFIPKGQTIHYRGAVWLKFVGVI